MNSMPGYKPFVMLSDGENLMIDYGDQSFTFRNCFLRQFETRMQPEVLDVTYGGDIFKDMVQGQVELDLNLVVCGGVEPGNQLNIAENMTIGELLKLVSKKLKKRKGKQ